MTRFLFGTVLSAMTFTGWFLGTLFGKSVLYGKKEDAGIETLVATFVIGLFFHGYAYFVYEVLPTLYQDMKDYYAKKEITDANDASKGQS